MTGLEKASRPSWRRRPTAPLAAWIVFSASGGDHQHTAQFVRSMLTASIATVIFVALPYVVRRVL